MTIAAENLGKRFNRSWIFRNFNHTFRPGIHAITGPNGSGKSTLLKVLWGQLPASTGNLIYRSDDATLPVEDAYRGLAIAAPYMELIEELTLEETVRFHFSFKGFRIANSVEEVVDKLEMAHAGKKTVGQFSSGMKQRLKLGLAFFSDVKMIFLDEPTTNLDQASIQWYWKYISLLGPESLVFIGSNLENEYPDNAMKINLLDYK
jgi:ABC-type multidrug transport system ATPase subunit